MMTSGYTPSEVKELEKQYPKHKVKRLVKQAKATFKLPTSPQHIDDLMKGAMEKMPFSDYVVLASGFYAGYMGLTPATMMLGMFGVGKKIPSFSIFGIEVPDPLGFISTMVKDIAAKDPAKAAEWGISGQTGSFPLEIKIAYACVGMIEAYMMTRPGAMGAMLNFVTGMAQATAAGIDAIIPG